MAYTRYNVDVANCRRLSALLVYCGVAVLVIVNGQSTTDDDSDKEEIAQLRAEMAKVSAELAKTKDQLASSVRRIDKLEGKLTGEKPHDNNFST